MRVFFTIICITLHSSCLSFKNIKDAELDSTNEHMKDKLISKCNELAESSEILFSWTFQNISKDTIHLDNMDWRTPIHIYPPSSTDTIVIDRRGFSISYDGPYDAPIMIPPDSSHIFNLENIEARMLKYGSGIFRSKIIFPDAKYETEVCSTYFEKKI